jgi:hypothetical protein
MNPSDFFTGFWIVLALAASLWLSCAVMIYHAMYQDAKNR